MLGSIGTAVYRGQVADAVPAGAPTGAGDAARDTLGGAVGAADQLPARVLEAAAEAFTQGMQVAALGTAALVVVVAGSMVASLRSPQRGCTIAVAGSPSTAAASWSSASSSR